MYEQIPDFGDMAQIAITLAGFSGLVGVLQSRREKGLSQVEAMHIANLLMASTFVVVLSFVPRWLALMPASQEVVWLWSSRILLAMHLLAFVIVLPYALRGGAFFRLFPRLDQAVMVITATIGASLVILEALASAGKLLGYESFLYQAVLLFFIAMGMFNFLVLLLRH